MGVVPEGLPVPPAAETGGGASKLLTQDGLRQAFGGTPTTAQAEALLPAPDTKIPTPLLDAKLNQIVVEKFGKTGPAEVAEHVANLKKVIEKVNGMSSEESAKLGPDHPVIQAYHFLAGEDAIKAYLEDQLAASQPPEVILTSEDLTNAGGEPPPPPARAPASNRPDTIQTTGSAAARPETRTIPAIITTPDVVGKLIKMGPEAVAEGLNARSDRLLDIAQGRRVQLGVELQAKAAERTAVTKKLGEYELQSSPAKVDAKRLAAYPQEATALRDINTARDNDSRKVARSKAVVTLTTEYDRLLGEMAATQGQITTAETALASQRGKLKGFVERYNVSQGDLFDIGANIAWRLRRLETPNLPDTERARLLVDAKTLAQRANMAVEDIPDNALPAVLNTYVGFIRENGGQQYEVYETGFVRLQDNRAKRSEQANKKRGLEASIGTVIAEAKKYAGEKGEAELAGVDQAANDIGSQRDLIEAVRERISDVDDELPTLTAVRGLQDPVTEANAQYLAVLQEIGLQPGQVTEQVLNSWKYKDEAQQRRVRKAVVNLRKAEATYYRSVNYPDLLLAKIGVPPPENLVPFVTALNAVLRKQEEPAGQTGVNKEAWDLAKKIVGELPAVATPAPEETPEQTDAISQIRQRLQAERSRTTPVEQDANAVAEAQEIAAVTGFEVGNTIALNNGLIRQAQVAEQAGRLEPFLREVTKNLGLTPDELKAKMAQVAANPERARDNPVYQMLKLLLDSGMTKEDMLKKLGEYKKKKDGNVGTYLAGFFMLFQILSPIIDSDETVKAGGGGQHQPA